MDAVTGLFQPIGEQGSAALCGSVFKVEYTDCDQRLIYLRLYSGTLRLRDTVALAGREKLKITEMRIPFKGEIVRTDTAHKGEIVILSSDSVGLNDVLGDNTWLPRERWRDAPPPMLRTRYGLEQGLFGWNVTDCKICFEYGLYYSPVSTPADFRSLAPIVLEQALKESGTQLLEPYLSFILYAPQEYLSRAYHDAPKYCATIETAQVKRMKLSCRTY